MAGKYDEAKRTAGEYETIFGKGNFFLEIQDHGLAPDKQRLRGDVQDRKRPRTSRSSPPTTRTTSNPTTPAPTKFCSASRPPAA
jgi:hypothetical protein